MGQESSSLLGNFFLEDVDRALIRARIVHLRFSDDILVFSETREISHAAAALLDEHLAGIQLERSFEKTRLFEDAAEAKEQLRKGWVSYLRSRIASDRPAGMQMLHRALDRFLSSEPDKSEFHSIFNSLNFAKDSYGCVLLASHSDLLNMDPQFAANYLKLGLRRKDPDRPRVIEECLRQLTATSRQALPAVQLHLLKILTVAQTGEIEGNTFLRIASDKSRLWPVRNWAWHAYAGSAARRDSLLMEAAREEEEPNTRRAIVAALRDSKIGRRKQRSFLRHVGRRFPESLFTAEWLRHAA
jgi:hypothetical protein